MFCFPLQRNLKPTEQGLLQKKHLSVKCLFDELSSTIQANTEPKETDSSMHSVSKFQVWQLLKVKRALDKFARSVHSHSSSATEKWSIRSTDLDESLAVIRLWQS